MPITVSIITKHHEGFEVATVQGAIEPAFFPAYGMVNPSFVSAGGTGHSHAYCSTK
jgi:hypothetical protein